MYISRHMEKTVLKYSKMFSAVMLTGSRQVGKTTMLRTIADGYTYVTLDDPILLQSAVNEAGTFFKDSPPPIFIDEIQYAPNLFSYIKMYADKEPKMGQFFLSGSQQYKMMKNAGESLAGRVGILNLAGLSLREIYKVDFNKPFIPNAEYFDERRGIIANIDYSDVWKIIHRGSMPRLHADSDMDWQAFHASYFRTYIERDVRELTQVGDELKFYKFMASIAASIGKLVNLAAISRDVGISQPTADRWLSVLQASNVVFLLQPYHNNIIKRAIKTPKVYFMDTGLAAYLTRWPTPETLRAGAQAGAFFENFIVAEVCKSYYNAGVIEPPLYFYRDKEQNEIDLIIQEGDKFHPIEIKKHADPKCDDIAAFSVLNKIPGITRGSGGVVCMYDNLVTLKDEDKVIPVSYL